MTKNKPKKLLEHMYKLYINLQYMIFGIMGELVTANVANSINNPIAQVYRTFI